MSERHGSDPSTDAGRRNALVVESAPLGIYGLDREGRGTFVNPWGCRILGYEEHELVGRDVHSLIHHSHESGAPYPVTDCPIYAALRHGRTHHVDTEVFWRKDGTSFPVTYMSAPILDGEQTVGVVVVFRDITERRRQVDALRESEQRYRGLVSALDEGIMVRAPDGRFVSVNAAARRITGMTEEELADSTERARTWVMLREDGTVVPPEEHPGRSTQRTGRPVASQLYGVRRKDGSVVWVTMNSVPLVREGEREPYLVVLSLTDVTARKASEEALRQSEQRFRTLATFAPIGIYWTDAERRCLYANDRWLEIVGLTLEQAAGHGYLDAIHPADRHLATARDRADEAIELRLRRLDGETRWALDRSAPIRDATFAIRGYVGTLEDITETLRARVERETEYRLILENSTDLVARHRPDGTFVYVSPNSVQLLGWEPSTLVGQSLFDHVHPDDVRERASVERGNRMLSDVLPPTFRRKKRDGSYVWFEASTWTVRAEDTGRVVEIVVVSRDITRRREAEEALRLAEEHLRHAQKLDAVGRLAGGIAHDFNNLLTVILSCSELLSTLTPEGNARRLSEEIGSAAVRAADLTRQLLAFGRKQVLTPRILDPNAVVREIEPMLARLLGEQITLEASLGADLALIVADPGQLHQCLVNLAVNARDAMPEGGKLTIATQNATLGDDYVAEHVGVLPGEYVMIAVHDTGVGMDEDVRAQIFEPFFTTKAPGRGTGLGLATVYGIVKQSGGHIVADSRPGGGTRMKMYFPRALPTTPRSEAPPRKVQGRPRGTETILLVEDDSIVRRTARTILAELGYTVHDASGPEEARALASDPGRRIDLLLTDVVMPGESGISLAAALRVARPLLRVVFMSGYAGGALAGADRLSSLSAFLQKPFSPTTLANSVRGLLDATDDEQRAPGAI